jgi:hypothetical protein
MAAIDLIPGAIGLIMGILFGISGFDDGGKTADLSKNQRTKNFLWIVGGATSVLLADWKLLANDANTDRSQLLIAYLIGAVGGAGGTILLITIAIAVSISRRGTRQPVFRHQALTIVMDYLKFGYRGYQQGVAALEARAQSATPENVLRETGRALSLIIASAALARNSNDPAIRSDTIDRVLGAIEDTVKLFAVDVQDLELQTNYMELIPRDRLGGKKPLFLEDAVDRHEAFLVTRRYRTGASGTAFLPLYSSMTRKLPLPGAPACAISRKAVVLNTRKIDMPAGLSKDVQTDIRNFFKDVWYLSVLSVPLVSGRDVVGVVNIEANYIDVVGKDTHMVSSIGAALAPHCLILGELVARGE